LSGGGGGVEENEYKDDEKVLDKFIVKLNGKTEEVDCIVTESHLVIEAEEVMRLPFSHIVNCDVQYSLPSIEYPGQPLKQHSGTVRLTYLDELNNKQKLSLEMSIGSPYLFKESISRQIAKHIKPMKGNYTDAILAFFGTFVPIIILTSIASTQQEMFGYTDLGQIIAWLQLTCWISLVPIAFIFLKMRKGWITLGIAISFVFSFPITINVIFYGFA